MGGSPPRGTKTFLMVDMVGSTRSWEDAPTPTAEVIVAFREVWAPLEESPSCRRVRDTGDGLFAVFDDAPSAVSAALMIDEQVRGRHWPLTAPAFRMALYTGMPYSMTDGNYGPPANRCQRLMEVGHGGQILAAETTVSELSPEVARRFLGHHRLRDLTAAEPVYQLSPGEFPPIRSLDSAARRLPRLRTATIGRAADIREVSRRIGEGGLTTLLGPGGVGKTRLALEAAAEASLDHARDVLADGLCFCDLAPIADGTALPEFVGSCLEIPQRPHQTMVDGIVDHLRHRRSLLVLDNCEHLLAACAELAATLLHRCPATVLLATSRAPLGLPEEHLHTVLPMPLPADSLDTNEIGANDAVHLFCARARDAHPELVLDDEALAAIGQICRQCDGLPLAIELIASRCRSLTPAEILEALAREGVTLPSSRPTAVERQRTIEHAIAWSYDLLDPDARVLLDITSVFAPEFDLAALEAVSSGWVTAGKVRRRVTELVDMSLLESHPGPGGSRLRALDTIRAFSGAKLAMSDRAGDAARRHAEHYLAFAEQAGLGMWSADELRWSRRFAAEFPNLRAAAKAALASEHWDAALGIPCATRNFGHYGGRYEVFSWVEDAARAARHSGNALLAEAFGNAGFGRWLRNDLIGARELADEGLAIEREENLAPSRQVRMTLMITALYSGDIAAADRWCAETIAVSDETGVTWLRSMSRAVGAIIEFFVDAAQALAMAREALAMADEIGNPSARCHALFAIGTTSANDDPVGAAEALAECVELSDRVGNQWTAGMSRVVLLRAQATLADRSHVLTSAGELLRHWLGVGDWAQIWTTLQVVAALLAERGRDVDALTVEAALVRAGLGAGFYQDALSQQHAATVAAARERVSPETALAARHNGERASERAIVERVLAIIEEEVAA